MNCVLIIQDNTTKVEFNKSLFLTTKIDIHCKMFVSNRTAIE